MGLFVESVENFSDPRSQLSNCNPLVLKSCSSNMFFIHEKPKKIAKFDGLEPRRCEDVKRIVAPGRGPRSFGTFGKQELLEA